MAVLKYLLCSLFAILNLENCFVEYKPLEEKQHKALFVFGDSIFDPGNNAYLNTTTKEVSLYWPYGEIFFHHPTGRFCDGRVIPDFIATLAGLPILPPYLKPMPDHKFTDGTNFASAGATVLLGSSTDELDLPIQVKQFKHVVEQLKEELGDAQARRVLTNAVYLFSIGANDYVSFYDEYPNADEITKNAFVNLVIGNLSLQLQELTRLGARKFAFLNLAPVGCTPFMRLSNGRCAGNLNEYAILHNKAFPEVLKKLDSEVPGFRYSLFDFFTALLDRVNNPHKYGFKEGQVACCGDGPFNGYFVCGGYGVGPYHLCKNSFEYLWFDGAHNSEGAYTQFSDIIWHGGPSNLTGPYTVAQLFQI